MFSQQLGHEEQKKKHKDDVMLFDWFTKAEVNI